MIGIVILAAGKSLRLGQPKQNLLFKGKTLLEQAIDVAKNSDCRPICIIKETEIKDSDVKSYPLLFEVYNKENEKGISYSVYLGISTILKKTPKINGIIIMVCDQPFVTSSLLNQLITTKKETNKNIIASSYKGTLGPPVLFGRDYFSGLQTLSGDVGAKSLIYQNLADVAAVPFPLGWLDIDTMEDLALLKLLEAGEAI